LKIFKQWLSLYEWLPVVSGEECIKALQRVGFKVVRQRGSHVSLAQENPFILVVVLNPKELDRGTLRSIIRLAQLTVEQFKDALK